MFPALAYVGKTLASVKNTSGGEPAAKPWLSCWFMSEAATISTLLPDLVSQALTVSVCSLTSAGPFEVIIIFSVTGPLWLLGEALDCSSKPPPPEQAPRTRAPAARQTAKAVRVGRFLYGVMVCPFDRRLPCQWFPGRWPSRVGGGCGCCSNEPSARG